MAVAGASSAIESPKATAMYAEYEALGAERSLEKLIETLTKRRASYVPNMTTLKLWSSKFDWVKRAAAYDALVIDRSKEARIRAIEEMNARQAVLGKEQQANAQKVIADLVKKKKFGSQAAVMLLKLGVDVERLANGAATAATDITSAGEQLGTVQAIADEIERRIARLAASSATARITEQPEP